MNIEQPFYDIVKTPFDSFGIVWWQAASGPRVLQTLLKTGREPVDKIIKKLRLSLLWHVASITKVFDK